MAQTISHIYDKSFKRILTLSAKSVISLINGLFATDYPYDSILTYNTVEHIDDELHKTLADTIITVNHQHSYHLEAQMYKDDNIIFRVFDYGYHHAVKHSPEHDILNFPEPIVLYFGNAKDIPEYYTLAINFGAQGQFIYTVPARNYTAMSPEEIEKKNLVILLPFYLLKLRKDIERERTPENLERLKKLIFNDILKSIENQVSAELLSLNDSRVLKNLLLKLYQHLYAEYTEMKDGGINDMVEEALVLDIDVIEYEHKKQIEQIIREKEQIIDEITKEKDSIINEITKEKDSVINEKDRIISAYRLLSKNTPVEIIIKETGLSREMIESL